MAATGHINNKTGNRGFGLSTAAKITGFLLFCIVLNAVVLLSWHPSHIANDGVQYLSTAGNWLKGHGFSTNALIYIPHFQGVLPAPQTVWPPGYPLLVGLTSMAGLSVQSSALLLNLVFLAISGLLVLIILLRHNLTLGAALLCTLVYYSTAVHWEFSMALVTEPLFNALILAALVFLPSVERSSVWPWIVSGVFIALCITVRYSGVFFVVGVGLGVFAYMLKSYSTEPSRLIRGLGCLTLQLSISVVFFAALLYRTYRLTGTIDRDVDVNAPGNFISILKEMLWHVREFTGFADAGILPIVVSKILFYIIITVFIYVVAQALYVTVKNVGKVERPNTGNSEIMRYVIMGHSAVFFVFFGLNFVGLSLLDLTHRYLYQIYPGLFILFCILLARATKQMKLENRIVMFKWFRSALVCLVCFFMLAQVHFFAGIKRFALPGKHSQEVVELQVSENRRLQAMIDSCFVSSESTTGSIWSNDGQLLHLNTGVPTLTLANVYDSKSYDINDIADLTIQYDVKMFIILNGLPDIGPKHVKLLSNIKQWLVKSGYKKVIMLEERISDNITVDVYLVEQSCHNNV